MAGIKRMPVFTLMIVVVVAISLTMLNFDDFSWSANTKAYGGLLLSVLLIAIKFIFKIK
ncbi:MAG: hypothetical protein K9H58_14755 [Bacteroidales bacterium]|nr:hypothetical protein [Bacteroidales bacterium]